MNERRERELLENERILDDGDLEGRIGQSADVEVQRFDVAEENQSIKNRIICFISNDGAFGFLNFALSRAGLEHSLWWYYPMFFFVGVMAFTVVAIFFISRSKLASKWYGMWLKLYRSLRSILVAIYFVALCAAVTMWCMASCSTEFVDTPSNDSGILRSKTLMKDSSKIFTLVVLFISAEIFYIGCTMQIFRDALAFWSEHRGFYNA